MAAKEDGLQVIELKVSVNCCEGCKRKVLKALSIKGVLKTEVHPSLPKITVYGDVDVQTLIKKLARCGKMAELWLSQNKIKDHTPEINSGSSSRHPSLNEKKKNKTAKDCEDAESPISAEIPKGNAANLEDNMKGAKDAKQETTSSRETSVPVAEAVISPNMAQNPTANVLMASHARVYYPMESCNVPLTYYPAVSTHYAPPPCYHHYEMPMYHQPPPPPPPPPAVQSQTIGLSDYFNDDNTVGCRVM